MFFLLCTEGPEQVLSSIRELAVEAMTFAPRQWESMASSVQAHMLDAGPLRRRIYEWGLRIGHSVNVGRLDGKPVPLRHRLLFPLAEAVVLRPLRDQLGLTRVRIAACGGATMAPDVFRMFHAIGVPLRNIYGSTETGLLTCHQGERFDLETVGHWMESLPALNAPLQWRVSEVGELQVRGGSPFLGYYRREGSVESKLQDGWFQTGDAVTKTERGELVFLERLSDLKRLRSGESFPPQFVETRLRFSPFIKDLMTLGDARRDYVAALVNIDMEVVGRWAEERNMGFSTFTDLSQRDEVRELIRGEIARINALLPEQARVQRFANFPKELDPDEGELTRSRKLRREFLEQRYEPLIDGLYGGAREVAISVPVTYQDGRKGTQQHIARGSFLGQVQITPLNTSLNLTNDDVWKELKAQIKLGTLPKNDLNTLYMVYFPLNVTITLDGITSCIDYGAYHFAKNDVKMAKNNIFYSVEPDCNYSFNTITYIAAHEFVEAVTDNIPTPGSNPAFPQAWNNSTGYEIGDLCGGSGTLTAGAKSYNVTQYYPNTTGHCSTGNYTSP